MFNLKTATIAWNSIFSIKDSVNDSDVRNRHPQLIINGDSLIIYSNRCNGYIDSYETLSGQIYKYHFNPNQDYTITIEYVRNLNQQILYINGLKLIPYDPEKMRTFPGAQCYGILGQLILSDNTHGAPNGSVTNFVYEDNVTGNFLGPISKSEIFKGVCRE